MSEENKEIKLESGSSEEPVQLTLTDIKFCKTIIETATDRNAWKADELATVGFVYNKITVWLQQQEPKVETASEETSEEQGETKND
jgi:hypothetical protein